MYSCQYPLSYLRENEDGRNNTGLADLGELEQLPHQHAPGLSTSSIYNNVGIINDEVVPNNLLFGGLTTSMNSSRLASVGSVVENTGQFVMQKRLGNGNRNRNGNKNESISKKGNINGEVSKKRSRMAGEGGDRICGNRNLVWADSRLAHNGQHTDTYTYVDTDDKVQSNGVQHEAGVIADTIKGRTGEHKVTRRLAQNREAARKSRLRKKAYIQQLEHSRLKLSQLQQELQQARQQCTYATSRLSGDQYHSIGNSGALAFDIDYTRWLDEHQRFNDDLRSAVNSQRGENEIRLLVDTLMSHYDEVFKLKSNGAKADVFHMLSGMWKTPAERCFMWLGGFRSSDLLKVIDSTTIIGNEVEPLTDQQVVGICNLQQSSQQAEDALSQGMEALQQSLLENCLGPSGSANVADYMGEMALAMGKLATLENFVYQADLLRQQTLQQLHRLLTTRQAARALLAICDYMSRLRALSSLWFARPKY